MDATLPEAIAIAEYVADHFTAEQVTDFCGRNERYQDATQAHFRREVEKFREPCPFLVDRLCTVYERRPLSCRGMLSPDASLCERWERKEIGPPMYPEPIGLMKAYSQGIVDGYGEAGLPSGTYNLSAAVDCILKLGPAAYQRQDLTTPVERYVVASAHGNVASTAAEGLSTLLEKPPFADLWGAIATGDLQSVEILTPLVDDKVVRLFAKLALPSFYESQDELEARWEGLLAGLEDFENAALNPREAFERLPLLRTFYWPYAGKDVRPVLERLMQKVLRDVASKAHPQLCEPPEHARRPGRFRLGYLSHSLTNFSGSRWAAGWLGAHGSEIETFAFNLAPEEDGYTNQWRRLAEHYVQLPFPAVAVAEFIRSLDLDALIYTDIGIGAFDHQLTSFRLARKQFTAWGHPVTSGSPAIDGYLSSALMEPENAQAHYTEKLIRLPGSGLCFPFTACVPASVDPRQYGLPHSRSPLSGSQEGGYYFQAQMTSKYLPQHDAIYRQISEASGKPIAFVTPHSEADKVKMVRRLNEAGVNYVIVPRLPIDQFHGLMARADAILDTPSWNGGNSTIDALSLRKPVISIAGEFMRGRHAVAFQTIAGTPDLIADSLEDYVSLALDADRQKEAMRDLQPKKLFDDVSVIPALEQALLGGFGG